MIYQEDEQTVEINAPLAEVWRLHTTIDEWPRWNGAVASAEVDGPVRARSRATVTTQEGRWRMRFYAITEPEVMFWGDVIDDGARWLQTWIFDETVRGLRLIVTTSVTGRDQVDVATLALQLRGFVRSVLGHLKNHAEMQAIERHA